MVISHPTVSCAELLARFPQLFTEVIGDADRSFSSVEVPETQNEKAAIFLSNPKALKASVGSKAQVLIVARKFQAEVEKRSGGRTILVSPNPELAMAMTIKTYFLPTPYTNRGFDSVHTSAIVAPTASLAPNVRVGPHAVIGAGVKLAAGVTIGANAIVEDDTTIDENTVVHPLAYIGHSTIIGKNCEIHPHTTVGKEGFGYAHDEKGNHYRIPHQGRVVLEDDVHLGAGCTIDRATFGETRIQYGSKFDNRVHIGHNGLIGKNSVITAGFLLAGSTKIGANFVAGGGATVTGHIEICDNVQIGGLAVVGKGIAKPGAYGGNPLLPLADHLKMRSSLAHVYKLRKQMSLVLKTLGIKTESENAED